VVTAEFNIYKDQITTLQNELNYECTNADVLYSVAATAGAAPGQQLYIQLALKFRAVVGLLWVELLMPKQKSFHR
jgi:hypothetical protein